MGVDVGNYGDHEVKTPEPEETPTDDDIIADNVQADLELTDAELDAQLDKLSSLENETIGTSK